MLPIYQGFSRAQYPILLSDLKRSWSVIFSLVAAQCLGSLCTRLAGGPLPCAATNTELLYGHSITPFLLIFLAFQTNILGVVLAIYNAALLAGLLGWPQWGDIKLPHKQSFMHGFSIVAIIGMRVLIGYLFGQGTGFACPLLFFNDAIHETTCGLSVIILYCIARRAYQNPTGDKLSQVLPMSLILWFPNALHGPIFFWSFATASITGIQGLLSLLSEPRVSVSELHERLSATKNSRLARFTVITRVYLLLCAVFAAISFLHSFAYRWNHSHHARQASNLAEPVLAEFLLLSYPRRNDSMVLSSTLQSYAPSLGTRFRANVYTTVAPGSHPALMEAQQTYEGTLGLAFVEDQHPASLHLSRPMIPGYLPVKQTLDLYAALSWAEHNVQGNTTRYLGIMEDDFEWCKAGWNELNALLYEVFLHDVSQPPEGKICGIFVATGGSGLLVRPSVIPLLCNALQTYAFDLNPDIILQDCLRGTLPPCAECRLAASRRLLLRHTGAKQSTYGGRVYPEDRWQCGWRQPFNGMPGVWVP